MGDSLPDPLTAAAEYDRERERFQRARFGAFIVEMLVRVRHNAWPPRAWGKS